MQVSVEEKNSLSEPREPPEVLRELNQKDETHGTLYSKTRPTYQSF